jgi:phosphoribosylaminoimidazolecarboxamide formyltransferase/IMP cyclohydrolase
MKNKIKKGVALVSVFNKKGVVDFVKKLVNLGYEIVATEGTGKELSKNRIPFTSIEKIAKNPQKLKDCIKSISFRVVAGILFDRLNYIHLKDIQKLRIKPIDIVICNFVPFKKFVQDIEDFNIKNIDVGGPLLVRAAATNFKYVLVIVDPDDYNKVIKAMLKGEITNEFRKRLAIKAFDYTRSYDYEIIKYLKKNGFSSKRKRKRI